MESINVAGVGSGTWITSALCYGGVKTFWLRLTGVTSVFYLLPPRRHWRLVCIFKTDVCYPSKSKSYITYFEKAVGECGTAWRDSALMIWRDSASLNPFVRWKCAWKINTDGWDVKWQLGKTQHPQVLDVLWYRCYFQLFNKHHYFGQVPCIFTRGGRYIR